MDYQIIATLGPSSSSPATWQAMRQAGATAFRLNTSHLTLNMLADWLNRLDSFITSLEKPVPVVLDLQGSKWRLGQFPAFDLVEDQLVDLILAASTDRPAALPVPHADFFRAGPDSSGEIVLNDAKSRLQLEMCASTAATARVRQGGPIAPNKGITYSASTYRTETLSEKDQAIFTRARSLPWIRFAVSYIKDADEMARFRQLFGSDVFLIAKLERGQAMREAAQIAQSADELWICRGDLGAEIGLKAMAESVHSLTQQINTIGVPVIMAGQVLEHMTGQAAPTRSEVCYLHDALASGCRGVVLSDETAIGRDPVESVRIAALFR